MKFFIEFCNHPPFEVSTETQWDDCLTRWTEAFQHPSYLTVDKRLVFKIHGAGYFFEQNGGDITRCQKMLDSLRKKAREVSGCEMIIGAGVGATDRIHNDHPIAKIFDFTCTYMDVPIHRRVEEDYPYEYLADLARSARYVHCQDGKAYMPYLAGGWNPKPWSDSRANYQFPTSEQWALELKRMKEDLLALPNLGLPRRDGTIQPAFSCYAWNEFGEGGIIAPTQGDGYMKLEEIRKCMSSTYDKTLYA